MNPFFTIVIATFNDAVLLRKTLVSIASQTFDDYQLIVVDCASSDNTADVVAEFRAIVSSFISEPDNGIYDAWNKALQLRLGVWTCFLGSGDVVYPDFLYMYRQHILSHPRTDFICCRARLHTRHNLFRVIGSPFDWSDMRNRMNILHVGAMHNSCLFANSLFSLKYRVASDYDFMLRCGNSLDASFINAVLLDMHPGGVSQVTVTPILESYAIKVSHKTVSPFSAAMSCLHLLIRFYAKAFLRLFIGKSLVFSSHE